MTTYHNTLPAWTRPVYEDESIPDSMTNKDDPYKWSNRNDPPAIGSLVMVKINGIGAGRVVRYFDECGWLGVMVEIENTPDWYLKQNGHKPCHCFGAEIEPITNTRNWYE